MVRLERFPVWVRFGHFADFSESQNTSSFMCHFELPQIETNLGRHPMGEGESSCVRPHAKKLTTKSNRNPPTRPGKTNSPHNATAASEVDRSNHSLHPIHLSTHDKMNLTCPSRSRHARRASMPATLLVLLVLLLSSREAGAEERSSSLRRGAAAATESHAAREHETSSTTSSSSSLRPSSSSSSLSTTTDPEDRTIVNGAASYLLAPKLVHAKHPKQQQQQQQHPERPQEDVEDEEEEEDLLLQALTKEQQRKWNELWADDYFLQDEEEDEDPVNLVGTVLPEGVDLNDYNLTWYDDETGLELTEEEALKDDKHRRRLISVTSNEFYNAKYIQFERVSRGIGGLGWSYDLIVQAQKWARYMASTGNFQHRSRLADGVEENWKLLAENIAMNTRVTRDGAHKSLMNSPGHRANILDGRTTKLGLGIARGRDGYFYVCQIFKAVWN
jgi:Cysteine-rich secretory protein family